MKRLSLIKRSRRCLALCLTSALLVASLPEKISAASDFIYNQGFEGITSGAVAEEFTYGTAGGSVKVVSMNNSKHLMLKNDIDGAYTYVEYPELNIENKVSVFSFDFLQLDVKSSQSVIFELKNGGETVIRIRTKGKDIVYDTNLVLDESMVLIENYYPNKWYNFTVTVDLTTGLASIAIGDKAWEELLFITSVNSLTSMMSYTSYSPGFMLDNLSCFVEETPQNMSISGDENIITPQIGAYEYEYTVKLLDINGNSINASDIVFEILPSLPDGAVMTVDKNKMKLSLTAEASEGSYQIKASSSKYSMSAEKNIVISYPVISEARIIGPDRIAFIERDDNLYSYECKFYDSMGNEMMGSYSWNLKQSLDGVEFDETSGTLLVKEDMVNNTYVVIEAVCDENPDIRAEKKIAALDIYTYRTDEQRMKKVLEYVDKVFVSAADTYNGTPLLANGIDVDTEKHVTMQHIKDAHHPNAIIVPSDIAHQYNFMRLLYGLTEITGDSFYKNRAKSIYQYYLDNKYYSPVNGLLYLGGHCCIDLVTGNHDFAGGYADIHEYKDHFGFYDPWFEVDKEFAEKYLKTVFVSHFYDLKNLFFNRHAYYASKFNTESVFKDLNAYDESDKSIIRDCTGFTFRSAGNDMMFGLLELYKQTKEPEALIWARRVLDRYIALQHPETNISVYQYNTGYGDPNCKELPSNWWLRDDYSTFTYSDYGDRFQNQFADDLIKKGYFKESERDFLVEGNYLSGVSGAYGTANLIDIKMAESIGMDTEEGRFYAENTLKAMAGVIKHGYIPEKNAFHSMMADGTILTGYRAERNGYYATIGSVFTTSAPDSEFFYAAIKVFSACRNLEGLDEEKKILWSFISNYARALGLGEFGEYSDGEYKVNLTTSSSDPKLLISMVELYKNTGNYDILNLARAIGNNIIEKNMSNGYFVESSSYKYSELDNFYAYSLILLDTATRNDFTSVPESYLGKGFFHTSYVDERGREMSPAFDSNFLWRTSRKGIVVKRLEAKQKEFTLTPGEKQKVEISVYPDDASASINWYSQNPSVALIEDNVICAYGKGSTKITGVSNDLRAKVELYVTVTEPEEKEE